MFIGGKLRQFQVAIDAGFDVQHSTTNPFQQGSIRRVRGLRQPDTDLFDQVDGLGLQRFPFSGQLINVSGNGFQVRRLGGFVQAFRKHFALIRPLQNLLSALCEWIDMIMSVGIESIFRNQQLDRLGESLRAFSVTDFQTQLNHITRRQTLGWLAGAAGIQQVPLPSHLAAFCRRFNFAANINEVTTANLVLLNHAV